MRHRPTDLYTTGAAFGKGHDLDRLFHEAMCETFAFHYHHCAPYRRLCEAADFGPADLLCPAQVQRIPHLFVGSLKERDFRSVPARAVELTLTSSGTGGRKSKIFLDRTSLDRILGIVRAIFEDLGLVSDRPVNYLCFTYDPAVAKDLGTAFSDRTLTSFAPAAETHYAIRWNAATRGFAFDEAGVKAAFLRFAKSGLPLRVLGFPSFLYKILVELRAETGRDFSFGDRSYVLTGGGWKDQFDRRIEPARFRRELGAILGIPRENFRDMFGMVEHGIPYMECERHRFHVPVHARAVVRDPLTMANLGQGREGLLHLYTPYIHSTPSHSLLTTDKALIEERCPCGREGGVLRLTGRGGVAKHKGCAIAANELLKR